MLAKALYASHKFLYCLTGVFCLTTHKGYVCPLTSTLLKTLVLMLLIESMILIVLNDHWNTDLLSL